MKGNKNLRDIIVNRPSTWKDKVEFRQKNRWLQHSSQIARRILAALEDNDQINQTSLAGKLDVSKQRISKIVKGQENLTLETIYNIEQALSVKLIEFPSYKYSSTSEIHFKAETSVFITVSMTNIFVMNSMPVGMDMRQVAYKVSPLEADNILNF